MDNFLLENGDVLFFWSAAVQAVVIASSFFTIISVFKPELLLPLAALAAAIGVFLVAWLVPEVGERAKDWGLLPSRPRARLFKARFPSQSQRARQLPWQWAAAAWCWGRFSGFFLLPLETLHQPRRPAPSSPSPSSGDCTELLYPCRQALIQAMDTDTRSAWRLVNTQTCLDVYESTRSLTWQDSQNASAGHTPSPGTLHLPLFSNCQGLKKLRCCFMSLPSLDTLPRGLQLEVLDLDSAIFDSSRNFYPLTRCCTPEGRQTLKELNLNLNMLGRKGAAALAPALKALTGLQRLDLMCNELDHKSAVALAPALQALTGLQHLNLAHNDLFPNGLAALVPALHSMTGLQQLDLRHNHYKSCPTARYAKPLATTLLALQLELQRNDLGAQGAATLVPALEAVAGLQRLLDPWILDLKWELGAKVTAGLVQALRLLHPQLQIRT